MQDPLITPKVLSIGSTPYVIDEKEHQRFDQRKNIFGRMLYDNTAPFYQQSMYRDIGNILKQKRDGYSRLDFTRILASWTVYDYFHGAFVHEKLTGANNVMTVPELTPHKSEDPAVMSKYIKETGQLFGASRVGVCRLDHRWVYSHDMEGKPVTIPEEFTHAIVMTIAMDAREIAASPAYRASIETGRGYSRMASCIACVAEFIRRLGYKALPMGNDIALSIPLAVDAGLGELGRLGLLITPEHGPCVRLCKVFTDLPMKPDHPISFGVQQFCQQCDRCAQACRPDAISREEHPSFKVACPSNNAGIKRWAVHHDRCYGFWIENGSDCSSCIAACPFVRTRRQ
jgi:hypothetical protein